MRIVAYYHEEIEGNVTRKSVGLEKRETVVDEPCVLERDALARIAELEADGPVTVSVHSLREFRKLHAELAAIKAQEPALWVDAAFLRDHSNIVVRATRNPPRHEPLPLYAAPVVSAEQQGVADGWRLVPVEPTPEILRAMQGLVVDVGGFEAGLTAAYRAAINAAPAAPAADAGLVEVLEKVAAYAPCSGIKDPGFTKMHMGILARDALAAYRAAPAPSTTEGQGDE